MKYNDLTKGPIVKELMYLALPIIITNILNMSYSLAAIYWVGHLGTTQLSAVGTASMFINLSFAIIFFARTGMEVSISQSVGRHDKESIILYAQNGIRIGVVLAVVYSIFLFICSQNLIGMYQGLDPETAETASNYLKVVSFGVFFSMTYNVFYGIFSGLGQSKLVSKIVGIGLIINMILDPIAIYVFNLDVEGIAVAFVFTSIVIFSIFFYKLKKETNVFTNFHLFSFQAKYSKAILKISSPNAVQNIAFNFISMIMAGFVVKYGEEAIAAQRIGINLESLTWMISIGITTSITIFIGQNYGAKMFERMRVGYFQTLKIMSFYCIVISIFLFFGSELLIGIFTKDPEVIVIGGDYLKIIAFSQLFMIFEGISSGFFNGQSKTKITAFFVITGNLLRIPLAYFASMAFGINGVWLAIAISSIYKGLGLLISAQILLYKQKKIIDLEKNDKIELEGVL